MIKWIERVTDEEVTPPSWSTAPPVVVAPPPTRPRLSVVPPAVDPPPSMRLARDVRDVEASRDAITAELERERATSASLREALTNTVAQARDALAVAAAREAKIQDEVLALATAVARRVVGREVTASPEIVVTWVREALAAAKLDTAKIAIAPDLQAIVAPEAWGELGASVSVDATLGAGACEVRGERVAVDAGADARIDAVVEIAA